MRQVINLHLEDIRIFSGSLETFHWYQIDVYFIPFHLLLDIYTEIVDIYQTVIINLWINIIFENVVPANKKVCKISL